MAWLSYGLQQIVVCSQSAHGMLHSMLQFACLNACLVDGIAAICLPCGWQITCHMHELTCMLAALADNASSMREVFRLSSFSHASLPQLMCTLRATSQIAASHSRSKCA